MTNKELAKMLNISPATLSLVINNKPGISVATRTKVLHRLKETGHADIIKDAPNTATTSDNNICFIVYKRHGSILDRSPFFLLIMEGVETCAHKYGYNVLFLFIDRRDALDEQIARLKRTNCIGAIVFATEMFEDDVAQLADMPFPIVLLDNDFPQYNMDCVAINNEIGTFYAVEHLVRMGHTKIGYLKSNTFINSFGEREAGYLKAFKHFGLEWLPQHVFELDYSEEGSYQDFKRLLSTGVDLPTAFVADEDTIATGVIKALFETGVVIPRDISIVGFNDRPLCTLSVPPLTSVRVPKYAFGAMAVELLVTRFKDSAIRKDQVPSLKYRIGTELVSRDSVRCLSAEENS